MIIVTGANRTGTSLMMKTLLENGFNIMSENFIPIVYENSEMQGKCRVPKDPKNVAKCFGLEIDRVNPLENIDGIIICTRDPMETFFSWMRWRGPAVINGHLDRKTLNQYKGVQKFVASNPKIPYIVIDFDDWKKDEPAVLSKLMKFLKINHIVSSWSYESNEMKNSREPIVIPNEPKYMIAEDQSKINEIKEIYRQLKDGATL